MIIGVDCGYRTGGVAIVGDEWAEVHDLPTYDEGGVDVVALMEEVRRRVRGEFGVELRSEVKFWGFDDR